MTGNDRGKFLAPHHGGEAVSLRDHPVAVSTYLQILHGGVMALMLPAERAFTSTGQGTVIPSG